MPELPEVETTVKGLSVILNQKISNVKIHTSKLRFKIPNNIINILRNSKISNLRRIAKFIIIDLDTYYSLVIHLGMSGRLKTVNKSYKRIKHDHFIMFFLNKRILVYHDPRKFGFIDLVQTEDLQKQKYILRLGVDALSPDLTAQIIYEKISKSEVPIKQILLNQKLIAGIGLSLILEPPCLIAFFKIFLVDLISFIMRLISKFLPKVSGEILESNRISDA